MTADDESHSTSALTSDIGSIQPTVVCGPSGVGKGTLLRNVKNSLPNCFDVSVSHTTRYKRDGEIDGKHYHFVSKEEFERAIAKHEFLEYAEVHGHYYGTSIAAVTKVSDANKICLLEIDIQGAQLIKKHQQNNANANNNNNRNQEIAHQKAIQCNFLFITTSNGVETLEQRLQSRGTENKQQIERRLKTAAEEIEFQQTHPNFFDSVIINDDLDESTQQLIEVFIQWYPFIKERLVILNESADSVPHLSDANRVLRSSKRQSSDFFSDIHAFSNIESTETRCRRVFFSGSYLNYEAYHNNTDYNTNNSSSSSSSSDAQPQHSSSGSSTHQNNNCLNEDNLISLIMEYTDIPPQSRMPQFSAPTFAAILQGLARARHSMSQPVTTSIKDILHRRWTIGHSHMDGRHPRLTLQSMARVYFAQKSEIMNGFVFQIVGVVRDPHFINAYLSLNAVLESQADIDAFMAQEWDECWDTYFYLKCTNDIRGSLIFSSVWANMLIFGLDDDNIRGACESGDWNLVGKKPMHFALEDRQEDLDGNEEEDTADP